MTNNEWLNSLNIEARNEVIDKLATAFASESVIMVGCFADYDAMIREWLEQEHDDTMLENKFIRECSKTIWCSDCTDKDCWSAGSYSADCPLDVCINSKPDDCKNCNWLKQYKVYKTTRGKVMGSLTNKEKKILDVLMLEYERINMAISHEYERANMATSHYEGVSVNKLILLKVQASETKRILGVVKAILEEDNASK